MKQKKTKEKRLRGKDEGQEGGRICSKINPTSSWLLNLQTS
jgi:hypothetical protein